ncbi:MAG: peptide-methionine (S)-S-oxide reductase MsrA [Bryobacteraceae bacterium]|jgi:peptide-methionine (S)-S-oxide reductase
MELVETATLGGGCFWCLEAVFQQLQGVVSVVSGYMGGTVERPAYEQVCSGKTGHAEVAQLKFDPAVTSFCEILEVFFAIHDPTTLNRQGDDIGPQYRSVIFWHSEEQRETAEALLRELEKERAHLDPIVTQIVKASEFWPAEDYHQNYLNTHPSQPYCAFVVAPKVAKFRKKFAARLRQG